MVYLFDCVATSQRVPIEITSVVTTAENVTTIEVKAPDLSMIPRQVLLNVALLKIKGDEEEVDMVVHVSRDAADENKLI